MELYICFHFITIKHTQFSKNIYFLIISARKNRRHLLRYAKDRGFCKLSNSRPLKPISVTYFLWLLYHNI